MSLVNEALKKARIEASHRQAELQAALPQQPTVKLYVPEVSPPRTGFTIGLIAAVFIVVLSLTAVRVSMRSGRLPLFLSGAEAVNDSAAKATIPPPVSTPTPPADSSAVETPSQADPTPKPVAETTVVSSAAPEKPASQYETVVESFQKPSQPPPPETPLVDGKVYIQSIDMPGAPKVNLGGILWSDKNPLAMINGISVSVGDEIADVTVVAIEPKRVKLKAQGREFFIRLP